MFKLTVIRKYILPLLLIVASFMGFSALVIFDIPAVLTTRDLIAYVFICVIAAGIAIALLLKQKGIIDSLYFSWDLGGNRIKKSESTDFRDSKAALLISGVLCLIVGIAGVAGGKISHTGAVWIKSENPLTYYAMILFIMSIGIFNIYRFARSRP